MKSSLSLILSYLKEIAKEWILWLFVVIDVVGLIVNFLIPSFSPPKWIFILLLVMGLIWSGYKTYYKLLMRIPDKDKPLEPKLSIKFRDGDEYSFGFFRNKLDSPLSNELALEEYLKDRDNTQVEICFPSSEMHLHIRIENIGLTPVDLLAIDSKSSLPPPFLFFGVTRYRSINGKEFNFPITLLPRGILLVDVNVIPDTSILTPAQIAVRLKTLYDPNFTIQSSVFVEYLNLKREPIRINVTQQISFVSLCDLYFSHLKTINRNDLISLARGDYLDTST